MNLTQSYLYNVAETQCSKDIDCHYAGKCITTAEGSKECECKNGTSGSLCQDVDDCVTNPYMCGNGTDVRCIFDVSVEKATCKCDNSRKKFDPGTETCRIPCKYGDCGRYGSCHTDFFLDDPVRFCWCRQGVRGDRCEIIDVCVNKDVDCGDDPTASCELDLNDNAYCKCSEKDQIFDYDAKICRDCKCGARSMYCEFKNSTKICNCQVGYYFDGEKCKDCNCGDAAESCYLVNGNKICECIDYFAQRFNQCALCDCGKNGENCSFDASGEKQCDCFPGFSMGNNGRCVALCNSTHECQNGGTCNKICQCPKGTSGDFCEKVDWCDYDKCGFMDDVECLYNKTSTEGYCKCKKNKHYYEETTRRCYECNCGDFGECILAYDAKVCICQEGYADYLLNCKRCDCGSDALNCSFKSLGKRLCHCKEKYAQKTKKYRYDDVDTWCAPCDCGEHGKCRYDDEELVCECEENYKAYKGKCKECFCGYNGYCDFNSEGEKTCHCDYGYSPDEGICTPCNCDPPGLKNIGSKCVFKDHETQCECPEGFKNIGKTCEDINECLNASACSSNTMCKNLPGTFKCECKSGFKVKEENQDPKDVGCEDINECEYSDACISDTTVCVNNPGSYDCVCKKGYYLTAPSQGQNYNPMYNTCNVKETQWRNGSIAVGVIFAVGIVSVAGYIYYKKRRTQ
ncbi:uncharacterized protein TNIN_18641 [Trichonephila inaurata madagascariensis]|uniref:EGF-like domain-containing protein n=1 Tax=Trichonephila inaurata madagascariensis TaxID=2747483 RepID=A0A8X6YBB9_9ARAC|nr:uncharacterized protein TNIN_18641 [Trichonephila inaurata madagascariensis]